MKGICQMCGCTDKDCSQCIEATGEPCFWLDDEQQICSRCYLEACEKDLDKEDFDALKNSLESERNFDLDQDEPILDEICPNCKRQYDPVDIDYQICHHCNFNNNKD